MLNAARECGMLTVWVGWESIGEGALAAYGADRKVGVDRERAVKTLKDHGIDVSLFFMLGSRADSLDDYQRAVDVADRLGVSMHPSLVVPYPGTELRQQYEPYIYKDLGWEYYTGAYALFEHPDPAMTPEVRERTLLRDVARAPEPRPRPQAHARRPGVAASPTPTSSRSRTSSRSARG